MTLNTETKEKLQKATIEALEEVRGKQPSKISTQKNLLNSISFFIYKYWLLVPISISFYGIFTHNTHINYTLWYVNIFLWLLSAGFSSQKSENNN